MNRLAFTRLVGRKQIRLDEIDIAVPSARYTEEINMVRWDCSGHRAAPSLSKNYPDRARLINVHVHGHIPPSTCVRLFHSPPNQTSVDRPVF
ncbi:hypothetical protein FRC12_022823 [Ceratobasidium sp. 428]|nr:hypothetical protein FRC12_022823 [Ceratobasidium sp. 428]